MIDVTDRQTDEMPLTYLPAHGAKFNKVKIQTSPLAFLLVDKWLIL